MKYSIIFLMLIISTISYSQNKIVHNNGIKFNNGLRWAQLLEMAKAQNKNIFVDCFTTWCVPCRQMDQKVYTDPTLGEVFNRSFISVKIQMDTTKMDNEVTKKGYADAAYIYKSYDVRAFPTLLFLDPEGRFLKKEIGFMDAEKLLGSGMDAIDPKNNYYQLLDAFNKGTRDMSAMSFIARKAKEVGDTVNALAVAQAYISGLKKDSLFTTSNILFMAEFTKRSSDQTFSFFLNNPDSIDVVMQNDTYARDLIGRIIFVEEVSTLMKEAKNLDIQPNWVRISSTIEKKYNAFYAERAITMAKKSWAYFKKNWSDYIKYLVISVEKYGPKKNRSNLDWYWNNNAWEVFKYSTNKEELSKALLWSGKAVLENPSANWMDTYANILYKLGYKQQATTWEEVALKVDPNDKDIQLMLKKMKKNQNTW